jgi:hypothetical protein
MVVIGETHSFCLLALLIYIINVAIAYPFAGHRVVHLSIILASFILRIFLVSYSGVLENLGKVFKLTYAKPLRGIAWPAKGYDLSRHQSY